MPEEYMHEYEMSGRKPAALAAIGWKHLLDIYEQEMRNNENARVLCVRYDSFTSNPGNEMRRVAEFTGLNQTDAFLNSVEKFQIRNADTAWQHNMDREDLKLVEKIIGEKLSKYGFV
jgi:hypothetical protein